MFFKDRDPYAVLGVPAGASHDQVKSAYRSLARRFHPDLATSEPARRRMIEINRAWEILGDPDRRAHHDRRRSPAPAEIVAPTRPEPAADPDAFRPAWMGRHATASPRANGWAAGAKGPPPGNPLGSVLDFGIYLGWSLGEIARVDPLYLDWLAARPEGGRYVSEIAGLRGSGSRP